MTVRLLRAWNGNAVNTVLTLDSATEAALVLDFTATFSLTGGVLFDPNDPFSVNSIPPTNGDPTKCEAFGASPSAAPSNNTAAIQSALNVGGTVTLTRPGTYQVTALPTVPAGAVLTLGYGVSLVTTSGAIADYSSFAAPFAAPVSGLRTVLLGDSITSQNTGTSATSAQFESRGWFNWANFRLGQPFRLVNNAGVGGNTVEQMLARISSDVLAFSPDVVFVMGGINNMGGLGEGPSGVIAGLKQIYDILLARNIMVVALATLPIGNSNSNWSAAFNTRVRFVNEWMYRYSLTRRGMIYVDTWDGFVNPTDVNGEGKAGYYYDSGASGELHPSSLGAFYIGKKIASVLSGRFPAAPLLTSDADDYGTAVATLTSVSGDGTTATATLAGHNFRPGDWLTIVGATGGAAGQVNGLRQVIARPTGSTFTFASALSGAATGTITASNGMNLIDNGLFQGSGGTASTGMTGTVATGWTVERGTGTATANVTSANAHSDGFGNWQEIAVTASAAADTIQLRTASLHARCNEGDRVFFECDIDISGTVTNLQSVRLFLLETASATNFIAHSMQDPGEVAIGEACRGVLRTPVLTCRASQTNLQAFLRLTMSGACTATVKVGRARLVKLAGEQSALVAGVFAA